MFKVNKSDNNSSSPTATSSTLFLT